MHLDFNYKDFDFVKVDNRVTLDWNKLWSNRGHTIGEGMLSPDSKYFYLNIPKNSSSSIKTILTSLGWTYASLNDSPSAQIIVAMRDPMDRWISGMVEYLMMYHQDTIDNIVEPNNYDFMPLLGNKLGMSLLFDRMTFDDHTERQALFLRDINFNECHWIMVDKNFNNTFSNFLNSIGYANNFKDAKKENSSDDVDYVKKRKLKEFITYVIARDDFKKYNIEQWLWCDYEIIKQAKFYEPR